MNLTEKIKEARIIAIIRGVETEKLIPLAEALYQGGIRFLEITYKDDFSEDLKTSEKIKLLKTAMGEKMHIGAGTVLSEKQVALTAEAGGEFIISPNTDAAVIKQTKKLGLISIPGALTPTEIVSAKNAGADFVKLFPVTTLGSQYVKAITAPLSSIPLLAVGGVNLTNIQEYLDAGVLGFGIGANIIDKKYVDAEKFDRIEDLARQYVRAVGGYL